MAIVHIDGKKKGRIVLYALSTCVWCRKAKKLLKEMGVEYDYVDVDLLEGTEKEQMVKEIKRWNPGLSFPTLVINDQTCIKGYDDQKIKTELER